MKLVCWIILVGCLGPLGLAAARADRVAGPAACGVVPAKAGARAGIRATHPDAPNRAATPELAWADPDLGSEDDDREGLGLANAATPFDAMAIAARHARRRSGATGERTMARSPQRYPTRC